MNTAPSAQSSWFGYAAACLVPPSLLAIVLIGVGPDEITVHRHADLMPLYFAPAALAFLGVIAIVARGSFLQARGRRGTAGLWVSAGLGALLCLGLLVFGLFCILMAGIGVQDGGWA